MKYLYKYALPVFFIIFLSGPSPSSPKLKKPNPIINIEVQEISEWVENKENKTI